MLEFIEHRNKKIYICQSDINLHKFTLEITGYKPQYLSQTESMLVPQIHNLGIIGNTASVLHWGVHEYLK